MWAFKRDISCLSEIKKQILFEVHSLSLYKLQELSWMISLDFLPAEGM